MMFSLNNEHGGLPHVLLLTVYLSFVVGPSFNFILCRWVAYSILVSAQGPLVMGLRDWGQGLTI